MSILEGAANITIYGGTFTAVSNIWGNLRSSNDADIISLLLSHSSTAALLDAAERFDAPKCNEGTRTKMLDNMKNFVQQVGTPSVFWLHGPAGVGKSALAQSLALSLKDKGDHAASFFFSRTSPGRNNGSQLITTLACQLALSIPAIQPLISKAVKKNPLIFNATNAVKMESLIVGPINELYNVLRQSPSFWARRVFGQKLNPRLVLVDGLDECDGPHVQRDLLRCIGRAVQQLSLPFCFIITSRPESHILATFELDPIFQGPHSVPLSTKNLGDDEDAEEQITTFLLKEFAEIRRAHPIQKFLPQPWPVPDQIAQLVSKSSKGFIYPATVIRYVGMSNTRPDECLERILGLTEIPIRDKPYEKLDALYRYIFDSVPDDNKEAVRNIFHFLVVPSTLDELITPRLIEEHFDYKPGHVQHVLSDLLCLVALTRNRPIKILHASLPDFILDRSRSGPLSIDVGDAHATIAASVPLAFGHMDTSRLPDLYFVEFLKHMMQANMSNTLVQRRLVGLDLKSQYMQCFDIRFDIKDLFVAKFDLRSTGFIVAYLLVLVIKNVQEMEIRRHVTEITAFILQKSPFAASLHVVRDELFPMVLPLFRNWASSTINHQYIDYILTFEITASQCAIRDEIFGLYLLMMAPFFDLAARNSNANYPPDTVHPRSRPQRLLIFSDRISYMLLEFLLRNHDWGPSVRSLKLLAVDLLGVSLAHAGYSASIKTLLRGILNCSEEAGQGMVVFLQRLTPCVCDYLERIYSELPEGIRQEILGLRGEWSRYLNIHK